MKPIKQTLLQLGSKPMVLVAVAVMAVAVTYYYVNPPGKVSVNGRINPAFAAYISGFTSGTISRASSVRIQLAQQYSDTGRIGQEANGLFSFTPSLKGRCKWIDATTVEFKPEGFMESGQNYAATFHLSELVKVPDDLDEFPFAFQVIAQSFEVKEIIFQPMNVSDNVWQQVSGTLLTADVEDAANVEQVLSVTHEGKAKHIHWSHAADKLTHIFTVDSVERSNTETTVHVAWDGNPMDVDVKGEYDLAIPALGDFKVVSLALQNDGQQYISIYFSDPLQQGQDLSGLITIDNISDLRFSISNNEVKVYPAGDPIGSYMVHVYPGIKNMRGKALPNGTSQSISFSDLKPSVSFVGNGVIMPASNNLLLPVEVVNLNAIDVTIIKIFENNVAQFLQVNNLAGDYELKRVGRPVLKKTIRLDEDKSTDLHKPNRFNIELDKLIKTDPGAIYQVKISFQRSYSMYICDGTTQTETNSDNNNMTSVEENWDDAIEQQEASSWDGVEDYYNDDYRWNERDNPCSNSYYNPNRWITRNVLASDLGIVAKKGTDNSYFFAVTDIRNTTPLAGVNIELFDYQQQSVGHVKTDNNGWANFSSTHKPFLLVASQGKQRGYLRIDDPSALSMSRFDVSGDVVQRGLKGFIYGERGVWRPGDTIFTTFILEDKAHTLPQLHPVSFELYNPEGVLYRRIVETRSLNGFYTFQMTTDEDAPTGNWTAKVRAGGCTFEKKIRIETVMPNRLKILFDFGKRYITKSDNLSATLQSRWLYGAIADGLKAEVDVSLTEAKLTFPKFTDFEFNDPARKFNSEEKRLFEGNLDAMGKAIVSGKIETASNAPSVLNANFVTRVFEPGGAFSSDRFSIPYHPYSNYMGVRLPKGDAQRQMLLTDTNHIVHIVNVSPEGNIVKGTKDVEVRLYKIRWRWWWEKSEEDLSNYAENNSYNLLQTGHVKLVNGMGQWALRINYPDWGRYMVRVSDPSTGHSTGKIVYIDWPGWAGRAQKDNPTEATMLTFSSDKPRYKVGEEATLTIPSGKDGRALVSIESGTRVVETHWVQTEAGQTRFRFKVHADMLPNVFVHVTLLQPHDQHFNDLPLRLYGTIPISVEDPTTILKPEINMANVMRPEENTNIQVSEAGGNPMTYTLAIVDEGLLDLTRYTTPDPHTHFYAREALGVKTWDMYDFVASAYNGKMHKLLSIGGDEGLNRKNGGNKANRFKPVVLFMGPFQLGAGKKATHTVRLPAYIGSVKVMVVAGENGAYGFADKAVPVKKPLMVLTTLPRVLGPGESFRLPVNVIATEHSIKNVTVTLQTNNLLIALEKTKTVRFSKPGDEMVDFSVKVKDMMGKATVKVTVTSGNETSTQETELNVRNANPYMTDVIAATIRENGSWDGKIQPLGMRGTNEAQLEISTMPAINLGERLGYLIQYPHGCAEQVTSTIFPQLALNHLLDLSTDQQKQIEKNLRDGINRLRFYQQANGGISYWVGDPHTDEWVSNYVGHFMLEAQNMGYMLPPGFIGSWKQYQRNRTLEWNGTFAGSSDLIQAYRLYTLALARAPELGAMNRMYEMKNISVQAKWRLAAAYALVGQKEAARQLITPKIPVIATYFQSDETFGSADRDEAMMLETSVLMGDEARANILLNMVASGLSGNQWMNTHATAYSLLAICKYGGFTAQARQLGCTVKINGKETKLNSKRKLMQVNLPESGTVNITSTNGVQLYARLIRKGQPLAGTETTGASNLSLSVEYKDMKGNPVNPTRVEQGKDFMAEVTIHNPGQMGDYKQMALSMIFPSGWEIHNARMDNQPVAPKKKKVQAGENEEGEGEGEGEEGENGEENNEAVIENTTPATALETDNGYSVPEYQDFRDDRVYTYFSVRNGKQVKFRILLNASYVGRYYMPAVNCESMYDNRIYSRIAGQWIEVVKPKETGLQQTVK